MIKIILRGLVRFLFVAVLLVGLLMLNTPVIVDRWETFRAIADWRNNPTPENEKHMLEEQKILAAERERANLIADGVTILCMIATGTLWVKTETRWSSRDGREQSV